MYGCGKTQDTLWGEKTSHTTVHIPLYVVTDINLMMHRKLFVSVHEKSTAGCYLW